MLRTNILIKICGVWTKCSTDGTNRCLFLGNKLNGYRTITFHLQNKQADEKSKTENEVKTEILKTNQQATYIMEKDKKLTNQDALKITTAKLLELQMKTKEQALSQPSEIPKAKLSIQNIITKSISEVISGQKTDEKETNNAEIEALKIIKEAAQKAAAKKRKRIDLTAPSTERNFITKNRALSEYLLKQEDLESLKSTKRRSPYEDEPLLTCYWQKDVEAKAVEIWGSKENLAKELMAREIERTFYKQYLFDNKKRLREYRREKMTQTELALSKSSGILGSSGKVVLTAIAINGSNFLFKLIAWAYTGSHSMFSECIHSLADTINQLILAYGIHKSVQVADFDHPYGYANMKYVASLISGVGIFCVGAGLSFYHGITGLVNPTTTESLYWAFCILFGSLISEGATLLVAFNSIKKGAIASGMTFKEYLWRGQDPSVNVVLLEDLGAVLGVCVAGVCMGLTIYYQSHVPDAVGSLIIGGILGCVASFIIYTNSAALVGRSIPREFLEKINRELERDILIRAIHDVKGIDMGNSLVRYKAEVDFDGRELAKSYLDKQDLNSMLEEVVKFKDTEELELFILKHTENIVDVMGGEIDRIETKLRSKFPEIRHCDLEIL